MFFWSLFNMLHPEIKSSHHNTLTKQFEDKLITLANIQVPQELQPPNRPQHQGRLNLVGRIYGPSTWNQSLQQSSEFQCTWVILITKVDRVSSRRVNPGTKSCNYHQSSVAWGYISSFMISPTPCDLFGLMTVDQNTVSRKVNPCLRVLSRDNSNTSSLWRNVQLPPELQSPNPQHRGRLNLVDGNGNHPWNQSPATIIGVSVHFKSCFNLWDLPNTMSFALYSSR